MSSVKFKKIDKRFNQTEVLNDINLDINDGEFVVLVGPSGCGKSTTLRILAGLEEPSSGNVFIDNKDITQLPPKDRDIAMVFQNYALYPHMTVHDNMAFGLKLRKLPKPEIGQRVDEAAEILGLSDLLKRKPKALSGGQRQRVALGRAIVRKPKVFLFDEPLSNLDAKLRVQMRIEIKKLHQHLKTTMVYVTHDQVEAMTMGDRIVVMYNGIIQQIDTPLIVYDKPKNLFVAGFIGSPAMNFIHVVKSEKDLFLEKSDTIIPISPPFDDDKHALMGIRPEDISLSDTNGISSKVEIIEPLGNEIIAEMSIGNISVTVRVPSNSPIRPGMMAN